MDPLRQTPLLWTLTKHAGDRAVVKYNWNYNWAVFSLIEGVIVIEENKSIRPYYCD